MARTRFDRVVIFAGMRTGSNFLEETLKAVPGVRLYGEAFNPHFIGSKDRYEMLGITLAARERDPDALLSAMAAAGDGLHGFRFFHDHDPRVLATVLRDRRCAKVILTRNPAESYVSRKIAAETGQWRLTDLTHARFARVRFDSGEFAAHLDAIEGFQRQLARALQTSGQTAFHIGYDDLGDVEVVNGLLRFLGVDERLGAVPTRLKKQNPEPLWQKVENFDEMEAALSALDPFELWRSPNWEPRRGPAVPGHVAAARCPLLFLPIPGGPVARVEAWLAALDGVGRDALLRGFTRKTLQQWKRRHPGHRSFTVVTHPLARAHASFCAHVLPTGEGTFPAIRAALGARYNVPLPEGDPGPDYDAVAHRAAFLGFLRFLKGNLGGQTGLRVAPCWASQSSVIASMAQVVLPDMVLRAERLGSDLEMLARQVGIATPPLPEPPLPAGPVALDAIHDAEIEAAARAAYPRDYLAFGYQDWRDEAAGPR